MTASRTIVASLMLAGSTVIACVTIPDELTGDKAQDDYIGADIGIVDDQYKLAIHYFNGCHGAPKDYVKAYAWFAKANAQGESRWHNDNNREGYLSSLYYQGLMLKDGIGVQQDVDKAVTHYLTPAANGGHTGAKTQLASYYRAAGDYPKAKKLLSEAYQNGDAAAAHELGLIYLPKGEGQNLRKAKSYFEFAARSGNSDSAAELSRMYELGTPEIELGIDLARAMSWAEKAAETDPRYEYLTKRIAEKVRAEEKKQETVRRKNCPCVGDTIRARKRTLEATVTGLDVRESFSDGYFIEAKAQDGAVLVTVVLKYKNVSSQPISGMSLPTIKLRAPSGAEYQQDTGKTANVAAILDIDRKVLSDVNPGLRSEAVHTFEISEDLWSRPGWRVIVDSSKFLGSREVGSFYID